MEVFIRSGRNSQYWRDCWSHRELLVTLAQRDIFVRYKQTLVGVLWVVFQPLAMVVILTFVFGKVAGLRPVGGESYALMVLAGLLPWQLFANAVQNGGQSMVVNANILQKIYFPRLLIPLAAMGVCVLDFLILCGITGLFMFWQGVNFSARLWVVPLLTLLTAVTALGPALFFAALNVRFRDVRFVLPILLQLGLYASPVAFSSELIRERLGETVASWYALNPMVGIIEGFRWALLENQIFPLSSLVITVAVASVFLVTGLLFFLRTEKDFCDTI
jgi:lipopolysaccharide transport system permease protein